MATLIVTAGGATSNSYGTLEEANTYFEGHFDNDSWTALTDDKKISLLLHSTRMIDNLKFTGRRVGSYKTGADNYQKLEWYRYPPFNDEYMLNIPHLESSFNSQAYASWTDSDLAPVIPEVVKYAQFEQALFVYLYGSQITARLNAIRTGVSSEKTSGLSESYNGDAYYTGYRARIAQEAIDYLASINAFSDGVRRLGRG